MKAERKKPESVFEPVVVTLETQEEVDKLFALCNNLDIHDVLTLHNWWRELTKFKSYNFNQWHNKLHDLLRRN